MGNTGKQPERTAHPETANATSAPDLPKELLKTWQEHTKANRVRGASKKKDITEDSKETAEPAKASFDKNEKEDVGHVAIVAATDDADEDTAVDEIMKQESDELLKTHDTQDQLEESPTKTPKRHRLRRAILIIFTLFFIGLAAAMVFPTSRYFVLNTAGVRSRASVLVLDNETRLPIKNVTVRLGDQVVKTESNGIASISGLKLGLATLQIERVAYESIKQDVTVGWGSNPLGEFHIKATGVQYEIIVKDYISGQKIPGIEARSGEAIATTDNKGVVALTLDKADGKIPLTVSADGYRTEQLEFSADQKGAIIAVLVPQARAIFAVHQESRYDVVSMHIDGKNRSTLLEGTGSESANTSILQDSEAARVAVVSHRDNRRGAQGQVVNTLTIIDMQSGNTTVVARAEHFQLIDWIGSTLVFQESNTTGNADDPARYKVQSYDAATAKQTELARANQFNAVQSMKGAIYFAPASTDQKDDNYFYRVNPNGTGRQTVMSQAVWSAVRTRYDTLALQTPGGWFSYTVGSTVTQSTMPASLVNKYFAEGPNQQSIWSEVTGGRGRIVLHDNLSGKDTPVASHPGLSYPIRWLGKHAAVVRVTQGNEVSDYAVSLADGSLKKITNVANTFGAVR